MVRWEHRYLLGTMVFTIAGDVVRDFDEEYDAWSWLEQEGWGLVAIQPPDPVKPEPVNITSSVRMSRPHQPRGWSALSHSRCISNEEDAKWLLQASGVRRSIQSA